MDRGLFIIGLLLEKWLGNLTTHAEIIATLTFRIDMPARLLILERFSCQHSLYSGQHDN